MTVESRHLWQQVAIMACRAGAAAAFSIWLINRADSLSDWKAVLGIVLLVVALLDLGWKIQGPVQARRTEP
jgi:cytochrome b